VTATRAVPGTAPTGGPSLHVGGRDIPVVLPRAGDPRLRLAAVLLTVQVLGQTVLDFKLSIAQILVSLGVAALLEITVTFRRTGTLVWPASGRRADPRDVGRHLLGGRRNLAPVPGSVVPAALPPGNASTLTTESSAGGRFRHGLAVRVPVSGP
jgi:hypothetical protein